MVIDRKFKILAVNPCNCHIYTEKNSVLFCAHDKAFPAALRTYKQECIYIGCGNEHIESIELLIQRVLDFQKYQHSHIPDTNLDCEIDRCIGGNNLESEDK